MDGDEWSFDRKMVVDLVGLDEDVIEWMMGMDDLNRVVGMVLMSS